MNSASNHPSPYRSTTQFELGHYKLTSGGEDGENDEDGAVPLSPQKLEYQKKMSQNLNGGCDLADAKILSYATKPPSAPEGYQNQLRVLYSQSKVRQLLKLGRLYESDIS